MSKVAFIFPGQGAQYAGMGKDFYDKFTVSREVYEEANKSLNIDIAKLCFEGPDEELVKTENTQPAILTTSVAMMKALENEGIDCDYTAGLSLGEYTALVKSKTFKFKDAVKLVKKRGKYMQEAVPEGKGGMAAILGLDFGYVLEAIKRASKIGVVEVANLNSPGQVVISGEIESLKAAVAEAQSLGAKKAVTLPVSAPFHSSLLKPAGEKLKKELMEVDLGKLEKKVITNVEAKPLKSIEAVIPNLVKQVSSSVLWQDSVEYMLNEGVDVFVEIGPGKSLTSFVKRIAKANNKEVTTLNVNDISSFEKTCEFFKKGA